MSYPDFSPQGYQVISELGRNREGGRIAWLATELNTNQQVVVKQFCFAQVGSDWSAFKEHEREIQVLQGLNHPGIPKCLGVLETPDGFCLIQEYKNAPNLAVGRSFDQEEIKQIAVKALEILVYLQNRIPPVIHRDIKPENILVDEELNVYLIDFGMSRISSQELAASSVFNGTPGFIPPEQIRKPTVASDLYSLGATLICLLTGTKSTQMHNLTDDDDPYVINFRYLLPQLSPRFLNWLELMVKPRLKERFANAQTALETLKPLDLVRIPEVKLSSSVLVFEATKLGEQLRKPLEVINTIPGTVLQGKWQVVHHPQDPPHTPDSHPWIVIEPAQFSRNHTICNVFLNTNKLMADKLYKRQLILRTNADPEVYSLTVQVQTAPLPLERDTVPDYDLLYVFLPCTLVSLFLSLAIAIGGSETMITAVGGAMLVAVIGTVIALMNAKIRSISIQLILLTAGLGISFGIGVIFGVFNPYIFLALAGTGLPLARMLLYRRVEQRKLIAQYRQSEKRLIKP